MKNCFQLPVEEETESSMLYIFDFLAKLKCRPNRNAVIDSNPFETRSVFPVSSDFPNVQRSYWSQ
jgi:hypothetical protein